ncbi:MAG: chromosome partitioning protein ParB, partial [Clostridia bacterium]|nr:chromosome partitioning protein ParB [Clostridia bacterium]
DVVEMSKDEAIVLMVESNYQRTNILPSEKAFAYKMRLDAMKRQGKRDNSTSVPLGQKLSREALSDESGDSQTQIQRYIRLTNLIPELLEYVDDGIMKMRPAVELSYIDEEGQRDVVDRIEETEVFPSHAQAIRMRKLFEEGNLNYDKVTEIMEEAKPNQVPKYKFSFEKLRPYIPDSYTDSKAEEYVIKALDYYNRYLQRQREQSR